MKGSSKVFKALQHVNTKSTKLRMTLLDFSGTAKKDQLVNPARGSMSMCKLMTNTSLSTIIGI
jgi:hypothetical protein